MDSSNRGRSVSADRTNIRHHSASPSPHATNIKPPGSAHALDQHVDFSQTSFGAHNQLDSSSQQNLFGGPFDLGATSQPFSQQSDLSQFTGQGLGQDSSLGGNFSDGSLFNDFGTLDGNSSLGGGFDQNLFSSNSNPAFSQSGAVDPRLLDPQSHSSDPNLLMAAMTTPTHVPTPPHLLSPSMQRQASGSPRGSPGIFQGPFPTPPQEQRHTSLDPSSAAYPQMQGWGGNEGYRNHRRTPSDAHSDVSSSAHPSPFLTTNDSFEQALGSHSPHIGAIQDPALFHDVMSFGQISINDGRQQQSYTPSHSPFTSPALLPQRQQLPVMNNVDNFGLNAGFGGQFNNGFNGQTLNSFPVSNAELFPTLNQVTPGVSAGQADIMSPPEFKIDLAPPSRQPSFEPPKNEGNEEGLTPPDRSRSRHRMRALSDPFSGASSRGSTPSRDVNNRLSPAAAGVGSRSPSPDPNRPTSTASSEGGSASKRTQKHPATFQCTLCPKRFTRAYNLRSHLRTHTDERPFVCNVCGKAFARQHDRKRHEGLHSGEKKFVCRGNLKDGNTWGCGRRFARADALGRHFRSEAGRVCIKPLLEEEAQEKYGLAGQDHQGGMGMMMPPGMPTLQTQGSFDAFGAPQQYDPSMQMAPQMAYRLPAALLAQYPSLGNIWDTLPTNVPDELDGHSGRSSFDASSAGEYEEGEDIGGQGAYGWASDVGP